MSLVAVGAIASLLPKLAELLKDEYGLQKGAREAIQTLSRELEAVHAVLRNIGDVPPDQLDEVVRIWALEVREASYDMEDALDKFILVHVNDPEPTGTSMVRILQEKVGKLYQKSKARRRISSQIHDIHEELEKVTEWRDRYKIDSIVAKPVGLTTIDPRIRNLYKRGTDLVGIEGPRDELINMLSVGG